LFIFSVFSFTALILKVLGYLDLGSHWTYFELDLHKSWLVAIHADSFELNLEIF